MASSTNPNPNAGNTTDFTFDIHIMRSILHTIHSSDLVHRQVTEARRTEYADTVSLLSQRITKTEEEFKKRASCGKRLQRFLMCKDRDYKSFVKLKDELATVYSDLLNNASPSPELEQLTPGSSGDSSKSGSSSDRGVWMKGSGQANKRRKDTEGKRGIDEQAEDPTTPLTQSVLPATPSAKTSSCSTIKASKVDPKAAQKTEEVEEITVEEQIEEWMEGRKGRKVEMKKESEEKALQADF